MFLGFNFRSNYYSQKNNRFDKRRKLPYDFSTLEKSSCIYSVK